MFGYESADQSNQSTWIIPYRNELVPPLHDTCGMFGYESADQPNQSKCLILYRNKLVSPLHDTCGTFGQTSFPHENFDPVWLQGGTRSEMKF